MMMMMVNSSRLPVPLNVVTHYCGLSHAESFLSWKRKTGGVPRTSRNAKSVGVNSTVDYSMPARNGASPLEDCGFGFGFGTGTANGCAESGNVSENLPATLLGEATTVPLRESMQPDLDRVPGQSSICRIINFAPRADELSERGEHLDDRSAVDTGLALEVSPVLPPHELSPDRLGDVPDLNSTHALDSIGTQDSVPCSLGKHD
jgi:hypothetical protein